jgi:putative transposase
MFVSLFGIMLYTFVNFGITVEDINFVSWSKGLFCKQSLDMGLGQFFNILEYVCSRTDTYFAKVDKNYTSQICSNCGTHTGKKELDIRVHSCSECGYIQDRDVAAAEVIRNRGLENIARQSDLVGFQQKAIAEVAVGMPVIKQPSDGVLTGAKA